MVQAYLGVLPTPPMPTMLTNANDVFELSSIPLATILNICDVGSVDRVASFNTSISVLT